MFGNFELGFWLLFALNLQWTFANSPCHCYELFHKSHLLLDQYTGNAEWLQKGLECIEYNKESHPNYPVPLHINPTILSIRNLNSQQSTIQVETERNISWIDLRLIWPPECRSGMSKIWLKVDDFMYFWTPSYSWKTLAFGTDLEYTKGSFPWTLVSFDKKVLSTIFLKDECRKQEC